jgi:sec-independent protein translocase protein TatC
MSELHRLGSEEEDLPRMGLLEHLEELRTRIVRSLVVFTLCFAVCWGFAGRIYRFLAQPIYNSAAWPKDPVTEIPEKLVFLGIVDPFILYVKVAALAAVFVASPFILFQLWAFVAPGLYKREKRLAIPFILSGSLLFLAGGAFAYYVAFPFAVDFLLGVGQDFEAQITVTKYLSFLMTVILGLGLMFELPTIIFLLARMGVVTPAFLFRQSRWAVVLIFVVAAIITPTPDVVNLLIFALPTILLYFAGIAVAWLFGPKQEKASPNQASNGAS